MKHILQEVQNLVLALEPTARIFFYGSRARGDARDDSDWDFLVILEQADPFLEKEILRSVYEYELAEGHPVSVFITSREQENKFRLSPFYQAVMREGIDLSSGSRVEEPDSDPSYSFEELVHLRFQKAVQAYDDAQLSFGHGSYSLAMNRLYYAAFYALTALLMKERIFPKTHQGVKNLFHKHHVVPGKVSKEAGILYNELFDKRMKGDYSLIYEPGRSEVEEYFPKVKEFLSDIRKRLEMISE